MCLSSNGIMYKRYGGMSDFSAMIIIEQDKPVILINAIEKCALKRRNNILKAYFDETITQVKSLGYANGGCGYLVGYGEEDSFYDENWGDLFWSSLPNLYIVWDEEQRKEDYKTLLSTKQFKDSGYFIKKYEKYSKNKYIFTFYELIKKWLLHKSEVEALVEMGLINVAIDNRLWKLSDKKKKEVISYIRVNKKEIIKFGVEQCNLSHILSSIKNKCSLYTALQMMRCKVGNIKDCEYIINNKYINEVGIWKDYLKSLDKLCKNKNDPYWRYPKDLKKAHKEIILQCEKHEQEINDVLVSQTVKCLKDKEEIIENYIIKFPTSFSEIKEQAKALNQCLVSASYDKKFLIDRKSALVFILDKNNNKPIATAEIDKGNKITQFYGDEQDRNNCTPPNELKELVKKYINKYKWNKLIGV